MRKFTIFANDSEYWDAQRKVSPRGIGADSQEREIKVIQSAKISQKPNLCNENKITVWKRHVLKVNKINRTQTLLSRLALLC